MSASPEHKPGTPSDNEDAKPVMPEPVSETAPVDADDTASAEAETGDVGADADTGVAAEPAEPGADISDDESILSEVDEAQFEDFDPSNVDIEERPQLAADEENLKLVGRHKRKRDDEGGEGDRPRRKKEGRREKKTRRVKDLEEGGERVQRRERKPREATPEDESMLDPATRM